MSNNQKVSKEKSIQHAKFVTELVMSLAIIGVCGYLAKGVFDRSDRVGTSPYADVTDIDDLEVPEQSTAPEASGVIYDSVAKPITDVFKGDLILVNNDVEYIGGSEDLVSILSKNDETGRYFFTSVDYDYMILDVVYEPMAQMIEDFYNETGLDNLSIYGSYRTREFQQQLYDDDLLNTGEDESTRVALPGHSEHESGYAFDFTTLPDYDFNGEGEYAWFAENCWKYGFILRYPEGKEDMTQIQYEPWHFRYVGVPHAYYMYKNDLALEEYIELLKQYPYDPTGEGHLHFSDDNGKEYEVYYVAADFSLETVNIPVPAGVKSTISGNNTDGFIVTVYVGEEPEQAVTEPETSEDEDTDEDPDEDAGDESDDDDSDEYSDEY